MYVSFSGGYLYDSGMIYESDLNFEKLISTDTRVLVVNPLNTYWSYFLTSEAAARASLKSDKVYWVNLACRQGRKYEINASDNLPRWRYRDTASALKQVFDSLHVQSDSTYTKLLESVRVPEFGSVQELREYKSDGINIGAMIFSGIASAKKSTAFSLEEANPYIDHYFRYASSSLERLRELIAEIDPHLILTTNDRLIASSAAISLAEESNICSRVIYWGSDPNKIQEYSKSLYDSSEWQLQVSNFWRESPPTQAELEVVANEVNALQRGPNEDSRSYLGLQKRGKTLPMSSRTAVFYAQSEHEHSPNFINKDKERFQNQYEAFQNLQEITKLHGWDLILKYHPMRSGANKMQSVSKPSLDWDQIVKMDHVVEISADSDVDTYRLIEQASLNIVWSSTVGLESISRECPTLVLGNPHWLDRTWGIHAWSRSDLDVIFSGEIRPISSSSLIPWYWFQSKYGSEARFFRLSDSVLSFQGNPLINERMISKGAISLVRFLRKLRRRLVN